MQYRKRLNTKEKKTIEGVISGRIDPHSKETQTILDRPHVAVALEVLLDNRGLSDTALVNRLKEIIERRPSESVAKSGAVTTNITAIDSNALATIRTIWQVKGKFIDKAQVEHSGSLASLSDEQLDAIISSGSEYIHLRKNKLHNDAPIEPKVDSGKSSPTES